MYDIEMRVAKTSDVKKSAIYIHSRLVRAKWPKVSIRACGSAIETMRQIVAEFKRFHERDYKVKVTEKMEEFLGSQKNEKGQYMKLVTTEVRIKKLFKDKKPEN